MKVVKVNPAVRFPLCKMKMRADTRSPHTEAVLAGEPFKL